MKILWQLVALLIMVYQTQSQYQRQQTFSDSGNILPYSFYFDVHQGQSVTVSFTTLCPNLRIMFVNQGGAIFYNYATSTRNNGFTYTFSVSFGGGMSQSISLVDWNNVKSCSWSYSFKLTFNCSIVTTNCNDCNSYTNCLYCFYGYFLYMNKCYMNIQNCVTRNGLECTVCASGYVLVNGACRLCSSFMPNCNTCSTTTLCSTCYNGYALTAGNLGCDKCSNTIPDCVSCSSSTVCTSCPYGYALANPTTCQLCTVTLSNCKQCTNTTRCTYCDSGYALTSGNTCQSCSSFIPDCLLCSNSATCTKCTPGFSFSPSACTPCTTTVVGCKSCLAADCLSCQDGYWFDNGNCVPCTDTISNCQICRNSTFCDDCATGTGLTGITWNIVMTTVAGVPTSTTVYHRKCSSCSVMSQCITCSTTNQCSSCNPFYAIYGSYCKSCSSLISYCLNCSSQYTCTSCISNQFALYYDNRCYSCSSFMDNCNTCSDRSTCTSCKSGTVLKDSRCKPCYIAIPFCKTCTTINTCSICQTAYQLDTTTGTCKPCQFFLANCSICSSTTVCTQCIPGTILNYGLCKTCEQVFPNCIACVSNVSCALCGQGSLVFKGYCEQCKTFINHCDNCLQLPYCEECFEPYITDPNKKCICRPPLYNVSDFCVPDKNCVNAYKKNGQVYCSFCNIKNLFYLDQNSKCVCKTGYKQIGEQCVQYCGDGMIVSHQCDDNNTVNGDGCSSQCKIQPDFTCQQLPSGLSYCRFIKNIQLHYRYTFKKLHDNKGQITVSLLSNDPSIIRFYNSDLFKFSILHNRSNSLNITSFYKNDQGDIIIDIDYNETIQNTSIELKFKFDPQYVVSLDNNLRFQFKGSNYPLVISSMTQNYKFNSKIMKYLALGGYVVALLSLFSDKFIAVEGLNTIQLTFFSLLLIYQNSDWPQAMVALLPLKYSTGFNPLIFQPNTFDNINSINYRKFQYIGICNYFLPNNFINSIVLFVALIIFLIAYKIKLTPQNAISELHDGPQKKKLTRKLERIRKVFRKIYNITFHFSYIIILQVIVSIYVQFSFAKNISTEMKSINKFITMMTLSIIFMTILENYSHFFLSGKDTYVQNFKVGSREINYKRVYFIYVIFNAVCIFFLYDKKFFKFTMSFYVLIVAIIYLLYLAIYRPYKYSFLIHGFTVLLNQCMYIVALLVINAINFQLKLPQIYFLVSSYLIMSLTFVVLFFIVLRVFYQYKYGEEKIKQQIQFQIEGHKKQQKQFLLNKTAQIEDRKKQNKKNSQNSYLYQNQKLQAQKIDFLNQLKGKSFLSQWEKDQAFFRVYDRKPINWVQQNQTEEKYKILLQKEKQRFERDIQKQKLIKTKNQKLLNKNYIEEMQIIKEKLRNEHSIKQTKKSYKKQQKKSKENTDKTEKIQAQIQDKI